MSSRILFAAAVYAHMGQPHENGVPTPAELAAWMRREHPQHAEPWASRLDAIPADCPRYPPLPGEDDLHRIGKGRERGYDTVAPPDHLNDRVESFARQRWWTAGAKAGGMIPRSWFDRAVKAAARRTPKPEVPDAFGFER